MTGWSWAFADAAGEPREPPADPVVPRQPSAGFPVQADAETWLGESWRRLLEAGVEGAWLVHDDQRVYGPLPLRPPA